MTTTCSDPVVFYQCVPDPATLCAGIPLVYALGAVDSARTGYAVCRRVSALRKRVRATCKMSAAIEQRWCYTREEV